MGAYESEAADRAKSWQERVAQLQDRGVGQLQELQDRVGKPMLQNIGKMKPSMGCMGARSKPQAAAAR